jgi:hypothetical protein
MACMIRIRFPNRDAERKAIGFLVGRFSCKSFSDGATLVPESALSALARQGIPFLVEGPATYEQCISAVRDSAATEVQ